MNEIVKSNCRGCSKEIENLASKEFPYRYCGECSNKMIERDEKEGGL